MANPAPQIDQPTAKEIASQVQDLLTEYVPDWPGELQGPSAALVGIFARFAEIIIQRLNRVPDKNFLAFLDLLGASRLPPQPARVPLTFSLAAGSATDAIVPAGTQVAAPPAEGEEQPVIFETERELVVTAAQLASVFVRDPARDAYADHSAIVESAASPGLSVFRGNRRNEHILYLGHSRLLGFPQIESLRLTFTLDSVLQDERELKWELWDGAEWQEEMPVGDGTNSLTQSGTINFGAVTPVPLTTVNSLDNRWLRCRLTTPITRSSEALLSMVRESQLPSVSQVQMEVRLRRQLPQGLSPDLAFSNQVPIDLGKDFFPFGEMPKLNDTLYLASAEAFSKDCTQGLASTGATVRLAIQVANSHLLPTATSVRPAEDLQLAWECWNGTTWQYVGTSTVPPWLSLLELDPLPSLITADSVVVQGTGQKGAAVTVKANGRATPSRSETMGVSRRR